MRNSKDRKRRREKEKQERENRKERERKNEKERKTDGWMVGRTGELSLICQSPGETCAEQRGSGPELSDQPSISPTAAAVARREKKKQILGFTVWQLGARNPFQLAADHIQRLPGSVRAEEEILGKGGEESSWDSVYVCVLSRASEIWSALLAG